METILKKVDEIVYREDLYPRVNPDPAIIQKYANDIDVLPPIEINQNNILIDGYHRLTAHKAANAESIKVIITKTKSETELYALALQRNATHGFQLIEKDKEKAAIRLYASGTGYPKDEISKILSISLRMVNNFLHDTDQQLRKERKEKIFNMWMMCYTLEEIAENIKLTKETVSQEIQLCQKLETLPKSDKLSALFEESAFEDEESVDKSKPFKKPIYNIWSFGKKTNKVSHFGNSEQRIVENLLYAYTKPFDIVVDPFAGGGSTIDICKKRLRRYWVSDRAPGVIRKDIRKLDIVQELPPLHKRWSEVTLTYLDPPYWKQAQNKYSEDAEDLANMPLEQFTNNMIAIIKNISKKQSFGVIALLIQPTQWNADNRQFTDHIFDIVSGVGNKRLKVINRISCPYSTQQCLPQMVDWAKENREFLVLTRELVIWKII